MKFDDNEVNIIDENKYVYDTESHVKTKEFNDYTKSTHDEEDPRLITIRGTSNDYLHA